MVIHQRNTSLILSIQWNGNEICSVTPFVGLCACYADVVLTLWLWGDLFCNRTSDLWLCVGLCVSHFVPGPVFAASQTLHLLTEVIQSLRHQTAASCSQWDVEERQRMKHCCFAPESRSLKPCAFPLVTSQMNWKCRTVVQDSLSWWSQNISLHYLSVKSDVSFSKYWWGSAVLIRNSDLCLTLSKELSLFSLSVRQKVVRKKRTAWMEDDKQKMRKEWNGFEQKLCIWRLNGLLKKHCCGNCGFRILEIWEGKKNKRFFKGNVKKCNKEKIRMMRGNKTGMCRDFFFHVSFGVFSLGQLHVLPLQDSAGLNVFRAALNEELHSSLDCWNNRCWPFPLYSNTVLNHFRSRTDFLSVITWCVQVARAPCWWTEAAEFPLRPCPWHR